MQATMFRFQVLVFRIGGLRFLLSVCNIMRLLPLYFYMSMREGEMRVALYYNYTALCLCLFSFLGFYFTSRTSQSQRWSFWEDLLTYFGG